MRGERDEENWEVRCDSPNCCHGVEWIYALGMKSLRFISLAKSP